MVDADEYQMQNSQNFKYRYYPPRLVELQDANAKAGSITGRNSSGSGAAASGRGGYTIWIIIIVVVVVKCFLMLGILYMDTTAAQTVKTVAANSAKSAVSQLRVANRPI